MAQHLKEVEKAEGISEAELFTYTLEELRTMRADMHSQMYDKTARGRALSQRYSLLQSQHEKAKQDAKPLRAIPNGAVMPMGFRHHHFCVDAPVGTKREHLVAPDFWAFNEMKFRRDASAGATCSDFCTVLSDADDFVAELLIRSNHVGSVIDVIEISFKKIAPRPFRARGAIPNHEVREDRLSGRFTAWRTAPTEVCIGRDIPSETEAWECIRNHASNRKEVLL